MVVADSTFKTSRVAKIVTSVSMSWEKKSVSRQKVCPLQQHLGQGHQVPKGHLEKRNLFILSLSSQVKSQSPHRGQLDCFRYSSLSRYSVFWLSEDYVQLVQFFQPEKSCKLQCCDSSSLLPSANTTACEKHVGEDFEAVDSCALSCLYWRLGNVTESFQEKRTLRNLISFPLRQFARKDLL